MAAKQNRVTVRRAAPADAEALVALVQALARHEGKTAPHVTPATLSAWLFGAGSPEPAA